MQASPLRQERSPNGSRMENVTTEPLPYGWELSYSRQHQEVYYFNRITEEISLKRPSVETCEGVVKLADVRPEMPELAQPKEPPPPLPLGWTYAWSSKHNSVFYFNSTTMESRWERPEWDRPEVSLKKEIFERREATAPTINGGKTLEGLLALPLLMGENGCRPEDEADLVQQAVCWIREANQGRHRSDGRENFRTHRQVAMYKIFRRLDHIFAYSNFVYLGVGFLELPYWCQGSCPIDDRIPRLTDNYTNNVFLMSLLETCLLLVYVLRLWMNAHIFIHAYEKILHNHRSFNVGAVAVSLGSIWLGDPLSLHKLLRVPIFISFTSGLRHTLARVMKSLPSIFTACAMLLLLCLFFSWAGMVIFSFTPGAVSFPSLKRSMKHMYILISTNDMPNIMLRTIVVSPLYGLFYILFLILSLYLLMNVMLANIYDAYKSLLEKATMDFYRSRRKSVNMAYEVLQEKEGGNEGIGQTTLELFLQELLGCSDHADGVLKILDEDGSGKIEEEEFRMVGEVLADPNFHVFAGEGGVAWLEPYEKMIDMLDNLCDYVSVLAAGLMIWQTTSFADSTDLGAGVDLLCCQKSRFNLSLFGISMLYVLELSLEIPCGGLHKFCHSDPFQNYFDLITVCALTPLELWFFVFGDWWAPSGACRCLALLRGVRCLRCLHKLPGPRNMIVKVYNGMEAFARVLILLFCVCYFAAQVGMMTMGGRVRKDNSVLQGTNYDTNGFWTLNFNDFPSALFLFWAHLVGNNANVWLDAFTTAFGEWVWLFFLVFDLICNFVLLNIVIALIIDCVMVPLPEQEPGEEWIWPDREDQIRQMFGNEELEPGVPLALDDKQMEQREKLRELFGD